MDLHERLPTVVVLILCITLISSMVVGILPTSATSESPLRTDLPVPEPSQSDSQVTANTTTVSVEAAVAGEDLRIDLKEILSAISYWAEDEPLPDTGGKTISFEQILELINIWAEDDRVAPTFSSEHDLSDIVLQPADLGYDYNATKTVVETRRNASGSAKKRYEQRGVVKQHKQLFTRKQSVDEGPKYIISAAIVYDNESAAKRDLDRSLAALQNKSGDVDRSEPASDLSVVEVRYEDADGFNQTVIYRRDGNLLYYTMSTAAEKHYSQRMKRLVIEMAIDVGR